jgi:hypothetical protein
VSDVTSVSATVAATQQNDQLPPQPVYFDSKIVSSHLLFCPAEKVQRRASKMWWFELFLLLLAVMEVFPKEATCTRLPDIYWNATNPM